MNLISFFKSLQQGFLKNVLTGAGLTLGTAAISFEIIEQYANKLRADLGGIQAELLGLMSLAGIDVAMSITLGAIVARFTMQAGKLTLQKIV